MHFMTDSQDSDAPIARSHQDKVKDTKLQQALRHNMRRRKASPKPGLHKEVKLKD